MNDETKLAEMSSLLSKPVCFTKTDACAVIENVGLIFYLHLSRVRAHSLVYRGLLYEQRNNFKLNPISSKERKPNIEWKVFLADVLAIYYNLNL